VIVFVLELQTKERLRRTDNPDWRDHDETTARSLYYCYGEEQNPAMEMASFYVSRFHLVVVVGPWNNKYHNLPCVCGYAIQVHDVLR